MKYFSIFKDLFLTNRFFYLFGGVILVFVISFWLSWLFFLAQILLVLSFVVCVLDLVIAFVSKKNISVERQLTKVLSLNDEHEVNIIISNKANQPFNISLIDELPIQFQQRDFDFRFRLNPVQKKKITYTIKPLKRGEYEFKNINIFLSTLLGFVEQRRIFHYHQKRAVYPSVLQMKEYELISLNSVLNFAGVKKLRRLGHSYEFEKIKSYVEGDDYRSINWKATGRRNELMVNVYEDEKSQQVFSIIDKSRTMQMPFNGLSLLDYSINTSLVISNLAIKKQDKAGLITFSNNIETTIKANRGVSQLQTILHSLYNQSESEKESDYDKLYFCIKKIIPSRSLIFLYTNFESFYSMKRILPVLRQINKKHILVVMFFKNTELERYSHRKVKTLNELYHSTIAEKFTNEKLRILQLLRQHAINVIVNEPEKLSLNTINKYLELKARGLI